MSNTDRRGQWSPRRVSLCDAPEPPIRPLLTLHLVDSVELLRYPSVAGPFSSVKAPTKQERSDRLRSSVVDRAVGQSGALELDLFQIRPFQIGPLQIGLP